MSGNGVIGFFLCSLLFYLSQKYESQVSKEFTLSNQKGFANISVVEKSTNEEVCCNVLRDLKSFVGPQVVKLQL